MQQWEQREQRWMKGVDNKERLGSVWLDDRLNARAKREGEPKWFSFPVGHQLSTSLENPFPFCKKFCSSDKEKQNVPEFWVKVCVMNKTPHKQGECLWAFYGPHWMIHGASIHLPPPIPCPTLSLLHVMPGYGNCEFDYFLLHHFPSEMTVFLIATSLVQPFLDPDYYNCLLISLPDSWSPRCPQDAIFSQSVKNFSWLSSSSTVWHQPSIWTVFLTTGWFVPSALCKLTFLKLIFDFPKLLCLKCSCLLPAALRGCCFLEVRCPL